MLKGLVIEPDAFLTSDDVRQELCVEVAINAIQIHGTPEALKAFAAMVIAVAAKKGNKAQGSAGQLNQEDKTGDILHPSSIGEVYIRAHHEFRLDESRERLER